MNANRDQPDKKPDRLNIAIDLFIDFLMENNLSGVEKGTGKQGAQIDDTNPLVFNEPITQSQRPS